MEEVKNTETVSSSTKETKKLDNIIKIKNVDNNWINDVIKLIENYTK